MVLATALGAAQNEKPHDVSVIHQVTDHGAAVAQHMFRFEPNILRLEPGETVRFLNSVGSHTVKSQVGLWPDDVAVVDIKGQRKIDVVFDRPGLYGVTCARHGRYGMTMLIAVGEAGLAAAATLDASDLPASDMARAAYESQAAALLDLDSEGQ